MYMTRRGLLVGASAAVLAGAAANAADEAGLVPLPKQAPSRGNSMAVSTYSFWQFGRGPGRQELRDVEKCIDLAAEMGFEKHQFEDLVKMSIFKITPAFVAEVRNEGLTNLTMEEVVKLKIFKIDAEFIRQAKAEGVPLNVERLVQRRIGVDRVRTRAIVE